MSRSRASTPSFQDLPSVFGESGGHHRTPNFNSRRTIGPGGFGRQSADLDENASPGGESIVLPRIVDNKQNRMKKGGDGDALECFLPFKLFDPHKVDAPPVFERQLNMEDPTEQEQVQPIEQMQSFISETAQMMVAPHCLSCVPHHQGRGLDELFKMETLGDLMKKHKDAFQEEYTEFGPASVWAPDPPNSKSLPVPQAARKLGKFFDLRGELSTINHVRRARCRHRSATPVLLMNSHTPQLPPRSVSSISQYGAKQEPTVASRTSKEHKSVENWEPPESARAMFPSSLQALYLAPPRLDVNIAEDARYNAKAEFKEGGKKAKVLGQAAARFSTN